MAETTECAGCGAPGPPPGAAECGFCGAPAPSEAVGAGTIGEPRPLGGNDLEDVPSDLPPAKEARRIRGLAVPLVAGLVVVGIGYPLTALAVTQVGQPPAAPPGELAATTPESATAAREPAAGSGRAQLSGAVTFDGAVTPLTCQPGIRTGTFEGAGGRFSVVVSVPMGAETGTFPLDAANGTFIAVNHLTRTAPSWTSSAKRPARGEITIRADRSVRAEFRGLQASGGGAQGAIDGTVEVGCA